jgi:4a-hydroxytetrahydrobiopterin dehydratase
MGVFRYPIEIAATPDGPFVTLDAVVDTGAFYTWVPSSILEGLGIAPAFPRQFKMADGSVIQRGVAEVVVRIDGRAQHTQCVFGDEGSEPLLGAFTLEGFALAPDPVGERLTPLETLPLLTSDLGQGPMRLGRKRQATSDLAEQRCVPCEGDTKPMAAPNAMAYLPDLPGWSLVEGKPLKIKRDLKFKDFGEAMTFVTRLAELAEEEGHHPDICISWNRVKLELFTHAIGGLSQNDFIVAAKTDALLKREFASTA